MASDSDEEEQQAWAWARGRLDTDGSTNEDLSLESDLENVKDEEQRVLTLARVGMFLGPFLGLLVSGLLMLTDPPELSGKARRLAGITVWIATWWLTEPIPLGVTGLLPLVIFPVMQITKSTEVTRNYSLNMMWLFFGGFQMAFALQKAGLHERIALQVMRAVGTKQALLMLGVMLAVGLLSMFLSNTSTTLMIVPVVQAMISSLEVGGAPRGSMAKPMLLGVAYSASCGGLGSLIGTPPNGVLALQGDAFGFDINFADWAGFGMPLSFTMILLLWVYFVVSFRIPFTDIPSGSAGLRSFQEKLGRMSQAEYRVGALFLLLVSGWCLRKPIAKQVGLPKGVLEDDTISMGVTILLFLTPARFKDGSRQRLTDWQTLLQTPWQLLFLFGGGFALANAFKDTGLSAWLGKQLAVLSFLPPFFIVLIVVLLVTFLTEVTSNTATSNVLLPIIGQMAIAMDLEPALLMVPATLAASCAFMLPVATPPNAIVFGTGMVSMRDMARAGLLLNLASACLITVWMFTWGRLWFDLDGAPTGAAKS